MKATDITIAKLEEVYKAKGYAWFSNDTKNYNLNLFGIRTNDPEINTFNDFLGLAWKYNGTWDLRIFPATTDPGAYFLAKPMNSKGTAILVPGQYRGVYGLRLHGGRYQAMCQTFGSVKVYRDGNKDKVLDFNPSTIDKGDFGINIHHAGINSDEIDRYSAGCQVFKKLADFEQCRVIWNKAKDVWGNKFTYTLLTENDFKV